MFTGNMPLYNQLPFPKPKTSHQRRFCYQNNGFVVCTGMKTLWTVTIMMFLKTIIEKGSMTSAWMTTTISIPRITTRTVRMINPIKRITTSSSSSSSTLYNNNNIATELPDSLSDAAVRAAEATVSYIEAQGGTPVRCRVDFDTNVGDETFPIIKTSTEFMQEYASALCNALIPNLQQYQQSELLRVVTAKQKLKELEEADDDNNNINDTTTFSEEERDQLIDEYMEIINTNGRSTILYPWEGYKARIYFPDEGNAAYAKQTWSSSVPVCIEYSSCGGVPVRDTSQDAIVFFFCPKASESNDVEKIIQRAEEEAYYKNDTKPALKAIVFVNPNLVDMGVTGFGLSGRMLRERLIDPLQNIYYLRTLMWGALTRQYPYLYSIYQEDTNAVGGYRLLETLPYLPSNPEVEDIYDIANGIQTKREGGGILDQFGDFVQGMMRL